jgi:hypothetical protein
MRDKTLQLRSNQINHKIDGKEINIRYIDVTYFICAKAQQAEIHLLRENEV